MSSIKLVICRATASVSVAAVVATTLLSGCDSGLFAQDHGASTESSSSAPDTSQPAHGVSLTPAEVQALGIVTVVARATRSAPEISGFGIVLPHEGIAQAVAELRVAIAAARQSRLALARSMRLAGTAGAMPADAQESAQRQAAADEAALDLSRERLLATYGQEPPWKHPESSPELLALASGRSKLVRVTFPLGSLGDTDPHEVRLARVDYRQGSTTWLSGTVWRAPADATVPGRSYFAILRGSGVAEGEHLLAWAPVGEPETGVLVPAAAAVIAQGQYYCYIEEKPGTFVRTQLDPSRPLDGGYFVSDKGIKAGDRIVITAAGQLLARELNPSREAE